MAKKKTTKSVEVETKPTIKSIPTGILLEEVVEALPEVGEENKVYRRLVEDESLREMQITDDFIWYDGEWHTFSFDAKIFGAYFARYQESVNAVIDDFEARIDALEGGGLGLLYEGDNITCEEAGASIGTILDVTCDKIIYDGSIVKITMTDMTIDGEPIDDVEDTITLGGLGDWNWQGGEVYADVFSPAYFTFGTKPLNAIPTQVTFGFTNEQEHFDVRTLVIGHIKVEIVGRNEVA